jgi:hypothetical protein
MVDTMSLQKKPDFIEIINYDEYQSHSDIIIMEKLRHRHLLVTGDLQPTHNFNKKGLSKLAPLDKAITIHGLISSFFITQSVIVKTPLDF